MNVKNWIFFLQAYRLQHDSKYKLFAQFNFTYVKNVVIYILTTIHALELFKQRKMV